MKRRVLLRASSGPRTGMGHVMRSRSVALELLSLGARPLLIVDDDATVEALASDPFPSVTAQDEPDWTELEATGAWLDGFVDWTPELARLASNGTPSFLVENRTAARDHCDHLVYPALHWTPDAWDREHAECILAGAEWIPLATEVRSMRPDGERDIDLFVSFGGSDPWRLTERVLDVLGDTGLSIVVSVGPHMAERYEGLVARTQHVAGIQVLLPGMPLARWFARSRAALTAVGTTLYELAFLGVPALVLANYGEDRDALEWYEEHGPHLPLGVAAELSQEGLRAAILSGVRRLEARSMDEVTGLGEGATRLARRLWPAA